MDDKEYPNFAHVLILMWVTVPSMNKLVSNTNYTIFYPNRMQTPWVGGQLVA